MQDDNQTVGDGRMAKMIVTLDDARKRREKEMLEARLILIEMRRKGYSSDTLQIKWLRKRAGLAT